MRGHKLVSEHPTHYMVAGPDGKAFAIAKSGLSGSMHAQLMKLPRHMDDGGDVNGAEDDGDLPKFGMGTDEMSSNTPPGTGIPQGVKEAYQYITRNSDDPYIAPDPNAPEEVGPEAPEAADNTQGGSVQQTGFLTPEQAAAYTQGQGNQGGGMQYPNGAEPLKAAAGEYKSGLGAQADAEGKISQESLPALQTFVAHQQAQADANQRALATQQDRYNQLAANVSNAKIDPNRMWNNASTANKIGMLAGIIISGFGANAGQGNMAMNLINKQIDNDIDAQKAEISKNENLLSANLRQTGNLLAAEAATRADLWATAKGQLDLAAARQGGALAKAKAQQIGGMFDFNAAQHIQDAAMKNFNMNTMYGNGGAGQNFDLLNNISGGRAIKLPDGSVRFAASPKAAEDLRTNLGALDDVDHQLDRAENFSKTKGTTFPGSNADTESKLIHDNIVLGMGKLQGINRLNEKELEYFENQAPTPGAFRQDNAMTRVQNIRNLVTSKRNAMLNQMVGSFQPAIPAAEAPPVRGTPRAPMTQVKAR